MSAMDYSQIADLYDLYVQSDQDIPFFLEEARGNNNVLELTSGTGRLSIPLIEAGVSLSCLDDSPEMLDILRKKLQKRGLNAPVYKMDVCNFSIPDKFDLVIFPFNSFAEIIDPGAQKATLGKIYSHLTDTGRFICTLHNPTIRRKIIDGQFHTRGNFSDPENDRTLVLLSAETYNKRTSLVTGKQIIEIYEENGVKKSERVIKVRFCLHSRENFEQMIYSSGFYVTALYGDYERNPYKPDKSPYMIWILDIRTDGYPN